ncbi:expressed unknown protein [Ectocarpus siliculosus]|uniref:Uncharacterized protein n=1 Tax=Ectocarpus siliculosus TaxID=2880 RepID=D7FRM6_ECTSI|nr:expressed unknown protein [Ectocarpus siliculosus]|eukprot:CBJ30817.1 expressed unknown protein [Ectocarpus siliculosus]
MSDQATDKNAVADDGEVGIEEEVRDFAARFARLVVSRSFREGGGAAAADGGGGGSGSEGGGSATTAAAASATPRPGGAAAAAAAASGDSGRNPGGSSSLRPGERSALGSYVAEAELSLRGSQRLGAQLEKDAGMLRSKVFPALLENARKLHALYVAIDRVTEEVMPEVDATVKRMEKAVYDLEEMRKEQVDTRAPQGSFGLGLALGAGLWFPQMKEKGVTVPEVFDTDKLFRVEEGGLAPL